MARADMCGLFWDDTPPKKEKKNASLRNAHVSRMIICRTYKKPGAMYLLSLKNRCKLAASKSSALNALN